MKVKDAVVDALLSDQSSVLSRDTEVQRGKESSPSARRNAPSSSAGTFTCIACGGSSKVAE